MAEFKHGDIISYNGKKCEVIEQIGSKLIVERLGDNIKLNERAITIDSRNASLSIEKKSVDRDLIRRR